MPLDSFLFPVLVSKFEGQLHEADVRPDIIEDIRTDLINCADDHDLEYEKLVEIIRLGSFFGTCFDEFLWVDDDAVEALASNECLSDIKDVFSDTLHPYLISEGVYSI